MAKTIQPCGFGALPCPLCGEMNAGITLDLATLKVCTCAECGGDFAYEVAVKYLADRLAKWQAVGRWIDMAADVLATTTTE
jgi:hypothetical protein